MKPQHIAQKLLYLLVSNSLVKEEKIEVGFIRSFRKPYSMILKEISKERSIKHSYSTKGYVCMNLDDDLGNYFNFLGKSLNNGYNFINFEDTGETMTVNDTFMECHYFKCNFRAKIIFINGEENNYEHDQFHIEDKAQKSLFVLDKR